MNNVDEHLEFKITEETEINIQTEKGEKALNR